MKDFTANINNSIASSEVEFTVSDDCNMRLQRQALSIEDAVEAYHEYNGARSIQNIFLALQKECKANKEGLYCQEGGVDYVIKEKLGAYETLRRSNKATGLGVIDQMDKYFQIFHDCAVPRSIGLDAIIADETLSADKTMWDFSDEDPVQIYDMKTKNADILESMDSDVPNFLS